MLDMKQGHKVEILSGLSTGSEKIHWSLTSFKNYTVFASDAAHDRELVVTFVGTTIELCSHDAGAITRRNALARCVALASPKHSDRDACLQPSAQLNQSHSFLPAPHVQSLHVALQSFDPTRAT